MNIITALMSNEDMRLTKGKKYLYYDEEIVSWLVKDSNDKELIRTQYQEEALKILMEG